MDPNAAKGEREEAQFLTGYRAIEEGVMFKAIYPDPFNDGTQKTKIFI